MNTSAGLVGADGLGNDLRNDLSAASSLSGGSRSRLSGSRSLRASSSLRGGLGSRRGSLRCTRRLGTTRRCSNNANANRVFAARGLALAREVNVVVVVAAHNEAVGAVKGEVAISNGPDTRRGADRLVNGQAALVKVEVAARGDSSSAIITNGEGDISLTVGGELVVGSKLDGLEVDVGARGSDNKTVGLSSGSSSDECEDRVPVDDEL